MESTPTLPSSFLQFRQTFYHKHTIYPKYKELLGRSLAGDALSQSEAAYTDHFNKVLDTEVGMSVSIACTGVLSAIAMHLKRSKRIVPPRVIVFGAVAGLSATFFCSLSLTLRYLVSPPPLGTPNGDIGL